MPTRPRWRRLQALRNQAHIPQSEFARRCDISQGYLSQLESVSTQAVCNNPSVSTALRIALALDMSIGQLLGEIGYPDYKLALTPLTTEVTALRRVVAEYRKAIENQAMIGADL